MGKNFKDLTGMKFGDWQVLYRDTSKRSTYFVCQCKCGNIKSVRAHCLSHSLSKSCGCTHSTKGIIKGNQYDLSGEVGVGYTTNTNIEFFFDKEDYDKIRKYTWRENERGYIATSLNNYDGKGHNKTMFLHQLVMGSTNSQVIDHKDRNKRNCVKSNLHFTTQQQNILNRPMQKNNTSGYVGVSINKDIKTNKGKKYSAHISKDNKSYSKSFYTIEEAVAWRREMEDKLFSEFYIYKKDKLNE